jgi:hypothetical protein
MGDASSTSAAMRKRSRACGLWAWCDQDIHVTLRSHSSTGSGAKKLDPFHGFATKHRTNLLSQTRLHSKNSYHLGVVNFRVAITTDALNPGNPVPNRDDLELTLPADGQLLERTIPFEAGPGSFCVHAQLENGINRLTKCADLGVIPPPFAGIRPFVICLQHRGAEAGRGSGFPANRWHGSRASAFCSSGFRLAIRSGPSR